MLRWHRYARSWTPDAAGVLRRRAGRRRTRRPRRAPAPRSPRWPGRAGARRPRRAAPGPPGPRAATPRARGAGARSPARAPRCSRLRRRRSDSVPRPPRTRGARRASRRAPRRPRRATASVLTIGTRQPPSAGASESTPRISRTIVSVSGWSALLTTITSGISITPALSAWIESPRARDEHEHDGVGVVDHVDLGLADADRLEEDVVPAGGVHQQRGLERRLGEAAERAARRPSSG